MSDRTIELQDQLSIDTPELVEIELPVAGIGSRCVAVLVDYAIQMAAFWLVVLLLVFIASVMPPHAPSRRTVSSGEAQKWAIALMILVPFLLHWGYFTLFEAFWNGQTPGKRLLRLRVIKRNGSPAGFFESMTRNLVRTIDALPGFYLVGAISIFATRSQQRLGDLVAGTLVVHSSPIESPIPSGTGYRTITASVFEAPAPSAPVRSVNLPADAVARLTNADLQMIDNFLARRLDLPLDVRAELAGKLSRLMTEKMLLAAPIDTGHETFLEQLVLSLRQAGNSAF